MRHRTIADLMTRHVVRARRDMPFKEIVKLLAENDVTAAPVVDELEHPVGVVSEGDLLRKCSAQADPSGLCRSVDGVVSVSEHLAHRTDDSRSSPTGT